MGRRALVTGASRGIGAAISRAFLESGWEVISPTRSELDLTRQDSVERFVEGSNSSVDALIINAAENYPQKIADLGYDDLSRTMQVNFGSSFQLVQKISEQMKVRKFGRIVGISSAYSTRAREGRVAYSASKAALEALIRTVAVEGAADGILANCVAPGFVNTELTKANNSPDQIRLLLGRVPLGKLIEPEEVARLVYFLASDENLSITGQTISIDGGFNCT